VKRLAFTDDETSSPVSSMFIKEATLVPPTIELQAEADQNDSAQLQYAVFQVKYDDPCSSWRSTAGLREHFRPSSACTGANLGRRRRVDLLICR
jgi:hypothetical protein